MLKLAEKLMESQLREYLSNNEILLATYFGFNPGYSSTTALVNFTDNITYNDSGKCTTLILLNFSRLFYTIYHNILSTILKSFGIVGIN